MMWSSVWNTRRPPRPALTIFVRLLPRLLDPVHGPIQKCKHGCSRGLLGETLGLGGSARHCPAERRQKLSCSTDNATRHDCKNNDARRRGEGAAVARPAARCSSGEATPQQRPSQDGCIDARGPAQRRDRGTRATQRPQAMPGMKNVHSPRHRADAAPDARPQQRNVQPSRRLAITKHA